MEKIVDDCDKSIEPVDSTNDQLIYFIVNQKDAFFKSQQRDEQDLSLDEKLSIARNLLDSNRSLFLHHYGKYLDEKFLSHIESMPPEENQDQTGINVQISSLREKIKLKQSAVRNRRYNAAQKLLSEGSYFSNIEMQSRNPYLFEQMVMGILLYKCNLMYHVFCYCYRLVGTWTKTNERTYRIPVIVSTMATPIFPPI